MKLLLIISLYIQLEKNQSEGIVNYYNEDKGFGYIIDNKTKDALYVYSVNIIDEIKSEDKVKYLKRNTRKGWEAYDVRLTK